MRKDEEQARLEEEKKRTQQLTAESEYRLNVLRKRAAATDRVDDHDAAAKDPQRREEQEHEQVQEQQVVSVGGAHVGHVHLFAEEEARAVCAIHPSIIIHSSSLSLSHSHSLTHSFTAIEKHRGTNSEHEAEERAKKEKEDRKVTMYLDQGVKGTCDRSTPTTITHSYHSLLLTPLCTNSLARFIVQTTSRGTRPSYSPRESPPVLLVLLPRRTKRRNLLAPRTIRRRTSLLPWMMVSH